MPCLGPRPDPPSGWTWESLMERALRQAQLAAAAGEKRLRFAGEEALFSLLHLQPGSVTPLGVLNDSAGRVRVFLDASFAGQKIAVHPNDNGATLCLAAGDLVRLLKSRGHRISFLPPA